MAAVLSNLDYLWLITESNEVLSSGVHSFPSALHNTTTQEMQVAGTWELQLGELQNC